MNDHFGSSPNLALSRAEEASNSTNSLPAASCEPMADPSVQIKDVLQIVQALKVIGVKRKRTGWLSGLSG